MKRVLFFPVLPLSLLFSFVLGAAGHAGLKHLAEKRNIRIGVAVAPYYFSEPEYTRVLTNDFNHVTPENQLKWSVIRPEEGKFDFSSADSVVSFALSNGMTVRGHNLVWHFMNPDWLETEKWSLKEMTNMLYQHIYRVVSRYKGVIREWDVVNEPFLENGAMRRSIWMEKIGPGYIEMAFRWAHEADPEAKLYINEYDAEWSSLKSQALYMLAKDLLKKKVPIHGVGFQCHWELDRIPSAVSIKKNFQRFADLGLDIAITEADIRYKGEVTEERQKKQAKGYAMLLKTALSFTNFREIVFWGVTDKYSWVPYFFLEYGNALLFDGNYYEKPAYFAIAETLAGSTN